MNKTEQRLNWSWNSKDLYQELKINTQPPNLTFPFENIIRINLLKKTANVTDQKVAQIATHPEAMWPTLVQHNIADARAGIKGHDLPLKASYLINGAQNSLYITVNVAWRL